MFSNNLPGDVKIFTHDAYASAVLGTDIEPLPSIYKTRALCKTKEHTADIWIRYESLMLLFSDTNNC